MGLLLDADKIKVKSIGSTFITFLIEEINKTLTTIRDIAACIRLIVLIDSWPALTVNDHNKELFGQADTIETLLKVITTVSPINRKVAIDLPKSRIAACQTLWNLAFLDTNKGLIKEVNGVEILQAVVADPNNDPELVKSAKGVLWMLGVKDETIAEKEAPEVTVETSSQSSSTSLPNITSPPHNDVPHVMISYNWGVQPIVLKLAKELQGAGYKVWLDVEQMQGSTLEAMASAIEGSAIVLICMTEKYKESPNCRLEGEYCSQQKKPLCRSVV